MSKKYYNIETAFCSFRDEFAKYLKESNIYYELSDSSNGCLPCYHFEVLLSEKQVPIVNNWIEKHTIVQFD